MKKALVTLRIGDYLPELWRLLAPFMEAWARKIGAEFIVLTERKLTHEGCGKPLNYEKFQIYDIAPHYDWTFFLDSDAFINIDTPDWSEMVNDKSFCMFNGIDNRLNRFRATNYSRRSGSRVGACTWNVICSDWTADLWTPPDNFAAAVENITLQWNEARSGHCPQAHLIDDYQLSENVARFGLKVKTLVSICDEMKHPYYYFTHIYNVDPYEKIKIMRARLDEMGIRY